MSIIKKLAGQTAIYGIPSIVGRLINFLLVFLFTEYFSPEIFAAHTEFYAYAAFFLVILPHGMETAYFNFMRKDGDHKSVFTTAFLSVCIASVIFLVLAILFSQGIANFMNYPERAEYVRWFALILAFDAISSLPFAQLRQLEKAKMFAAIRSSGIILNVGLNVLFIVFFPRWFAENEVWFYREDIGIGYVFIANLIASAAMMIMLIPHSIRSLGIFDRELWKSMLRYAAPLILVGLAGIVNETFDRAAMDKLLSTENPKFDIGVYGAFYKLSIIITIFIQAFRYAAEPFFFDRSKDLDAKLVYARVMNYFIWVCLFIALATMLFFDLIAPLAIRQDAYFEHADGIAIVPILLLANVFLGALYNLSIWYKVEEKTRIGAWISIAGAITTIVLLVTLLPNYGIIAAAWTTLFVYAGMAVLSYLYGQKHYPVPYDILKIGLMFLAAFCLFYTDQLLFGSYSVQLVEAVHDFKYFGLKTLTLVGFMAVAYSVVIGFKKA